MEPCYPGVYIGSWEIRIPGNHSLFGARHTAVCCVDRGGNRAVTELVGLTDRVFNEIETRPAPYYGGQSFAAYCWVGVAPVTATPRVRTAIGLARLKFVGRVYRIADSNRFVSWVIAYAHIRLSAYQLLSIGTAPGLVDFPDG